MSYIFENLKHKGYHPTKIFDLGAYHGLWSKEIMNIYSNCEYYLYEANEYEQLNNYVNLNFNMKKFNVVLNYKKEEVNWFTNKTTGDSMFRELSNHYINSNIVKKQTIDLDTHLYENNIIIKDTDRVIIKIDCQGAEIPILKGANNLLIYTNFIFMEIPLFSQYNENVPNFLEHIKFMDSIGFVPYDTGDKYLIDGFIKQIDMMFINKNHYFNIISKHN